MIRKHKSPMTWFFLLFAVVFGFASVMMFIFLLLPEIQARNIAKNGTPSVGIVTDARSNTTVNDVSMYNIYFTYIDEDGVQQEGKTGAAYTRANALSIQKAGTIPIKILNGRAGAADYDGEFFPFIMFIPFAAVSVGMFIAFGKGLATRIRTSALFRDGRDDTGQFLSYHGGMTVNGVPYYKVFFSFRGAEGVKEQKTGYIFLHREAEYLQSLGKIDIKTDGHRAVISQDISGANEFARAQQREAFEIPEGGKVYTPGAEDKIYGIIRLEIDKEPTRAAKLALLEQHKDSMEGITYLQLKKYIDETC